MCQEQAQRSVVCQEQAQRSVVCHEQAQRSGAYQEPYMHSEEGSLVWIRPIRSMS